MKNRRFFWKELKKEINAFKFKKQILIFIGIIIWLICFLGKVSLAKELLFWTFSTVMQSFVALGALLGMVAVFRLQIINNKIEKLALAIRRPMVDFRGSLFDTYLPEDVLREAKKILKEKESNQIHNAIKLVIPQLEKLFDEEKKIKKQIIDFVKRIVIVTICALVFLIFTPLIIKLYFGAASLGVVLYLAIPPLNATIKLIKEIL